MTPDLEAIPETTLWTLHNRAGEAKRPDGILRDKDAIRIYESIEYDYERSFGLSEPFHAVRSKAFDDAVVGFLAEHPEGVIVNLGEGLETQRFRVDAPTATWVSVDVPEAIELRERFITPDDRHVHLRLSALDLNWFEHIPQRPTFVTAQGLFMYFEPHEVQGLLKAMSERFPGGSVMFDAIPRWLSRRTTSEKGWQKTPHYKTPPMPWGIGRNEVEPTLKSWAPAIESVDVMPFPPLPRGFMGRWVLHVMNQVPGVNQLAPNLVRAWFKG